jgi:hypothetical protein
MWIHTLYVHFVHSFHTHSYVAGPVSHEPANHNFIMVQHFILYLHDNHVFFQYLNFMLVLIMFSPARFPSLSSSDLVFIIFCTVFYSYPRLRCLIRPAPLPTFPFPLIRPRIFTQEDILNSILLTSRQPPCQQNTHPSRHP